MAEDPSEGRKGEPEPKSGEPGKEKPAAPSTSATAATPEAKSEPPQRGGEEAAKPAAAPAGKKAETPSAVPPSGPRGPSLTAAKAAPPTAKKKGGFLGRAIGLLAILVLLVLGVFGTRDLWWQRLPENLKGSLAALAPQQEGLDAVKERLQKLEQEVTARQTAADKTREAQAKELAAVKGEIGALGQRFDAFAKSVAELGQRVEQVGETTARPGEAGAAVPVELAARLDRLEAEVRRASALGQQAGAIQNIESRLQELAALDQRIRNVEQATLTSVAASEKVAATTLAVDRLAVAARGAGPFAEELRVLRSTAGEDPRLAEAYGALAPLAATGVPTVADLYQRFPETAGAAVRASRRMEGDGWAERALNRLTSLVTVRRTGEAAVRDGGVDSVVAVAERSLAAGDLAAAVTALQSLEGASREAAADWIRDAEARLTVERTVSRIQSSVLSLAGKSGS
jgi:hypothetical protein